MIKKLFWPLKWWHIGFLVGIGLNLFFTLLNLYLFPRYSAPISMRYILALLYSPFFWTALIMGIVFDFISTWSKRLRGGRTSLIYSPDALQILPEKEKNLLTWFCGQGPYYVYFIGTFLFSFFVVNYDPSGSIFNVSGWVFVPFIWTAFLVASLGYFLTKRHLLRKDRIESLPVGFLFWIVIGIITGFVTMFLTIVMFEYDQLFS